MKRRFVGLGALVLLASGMVALEFAGRVRSEVLRDAEVPILERQGNDLRAALENYRRQHNRYPVRLLDAGVTDTAFATRFGPWRYARADEGEAAAPECRGPYSLSVGDYDRHHFELCWRWRRQAWGWNR